MNRFRARWRQAETPPLEWDLSGMGRSFNRNRDFLAALHEHETLSNLLRKTLRIFAKNKVRTEKVEARQR